MTPPSRNTAPAWRPLLDYRHTQLCVCTTRGLVFRLSEYNGTLKRNTSFRLHGTQPCTDPRLCNFQTPVKNAPVDDSLHRNPHAHEEAEEADVLSLMFRLMPKISIAWWSGATHEYNLQKSMGGILCRAVLSASPVFSDCKRFKKCPANRHQPVSAGNHHLKLSCKMKSVRRLDYQFR